MTISGLTTTRSDMNVLPLLVLNLGAFRIILGRIRRGFSVVLICVGFAVSVAGLVCHSGFSFLTTYFDSLVLVITLRSNLNKIEKKKKNVTVALP